MEKDEKLDQLVATAVDGSELEWRLAIIDIAVLQGNLPGSTLMCNLVIQPTGVQ